MAKRFEPKTHRSSFNSVTDQIEKVELTRVELGIRRCHQVIDGIALPMEQEESREFIDRLVLLVGRMKRHTDGKIPMTGLLVRVELDDGSFASVDIDQLNDRELARFVAAQRTKGHQDGWNWVEALVKWIRDNAIPKETTDASESGGIPPIPGPG